MKVAQLYEIAARLKSRADHSGSGHCMPTREVLDASSPSSMTRDTCLRLFESYLPLSVNSATMINACCPWICRIGLDDGVDRSGDS